ncbi:MAG: hypothetical protein VST65_03180 [Nitrospirota bacterium]|nr:hypothetical protein [Nitrospirota bacterium]
MLRAVARNLVLIMTMGGFLPAAGCTLSSETTGQPGTDIVVFVDFSQSIDRADRALFEQDFTDRIIPSLSPGDRILIAPINDKTLTDFHPLLEETLPPTPEFNGWLDNVLKYNRQVRDTDAQVVKLRESIQQKVAGIFAARYTSQQTDILSSLLIAEKLFHNEPRHKVLILMSDMIVDYPPYRFERIDWGPSTNQEILSEIEEKGLIPNLSGVCLFVSGASARSAQLAENIGQFWQEYFRRTKADMNPSRYAHVLLHWPPSKSCARDEGPSDTRKVVTSKKEK